MWQDHECYYTAHLNLLWGREIERSHAALQIVFDDGQDLELKWNIIINMHFQGANGLNVNEWYNCSGISRRQE